MNITNESERLKEWYINFIELFRQEYASLLEIEKTHTSKIHDFTPKCQIEVFWLKQPEWQIIVTTHFEDRPDLEITINGPYESTVFSNEVKKIINQPRWHRPLYRGNSPVHSTTPNFYDEYLALKLNKFIEMAKNAMFVDWNVTNTVSDSVSFDEGVIEHFFNNIGKFDYNSLVKKLIQDIKNQHDYTRKFPSESIESQQILYPKGYGAYLFPPIIIGKLEKLTASDILEGRTDINFSTFDKKSLNVELMQIPVIITKDGFIGICIEDMEKSINILNTIMGVLVLEDMEVDIVREHELVSINYDPQSYNIKGYSYNMESPRNELFNGIKRNEIPQYKIREIEEDRIKEILEKVDEILKNDVLSREIILHFESIAHVKESEFVPAFLMSWNMIEQDLVETWKVEKYDNNGVSDKITKTPRIVDIIELLHDKDRITNDDYSMYTNLRKKRNGHLHKGTRITKNDAELCINIAKNMIFRKLPLGKN